MRKVIRFLAMVLNALVGIEEEKPATRYMSVYEAQEKLDAGSISMREYNEAFERKEVI
ncbi:hypothetical protein [Legionella maceachernii]|uniref:Uncharacterized protein n=1 Tax=Legionella maceachernii TaxID=466 RepID=A0A0W0VY08_9GAMM|nr:hypothetical protein [Legionella maceachernii]KTD25127.1 hypothetical protein Lmac_2105 [Legionella maceachernii]SKA27523.1 hypothetical protein SAMN02745128_02983 [Legionella maceachernii]SUP04663.1 Uncharacterised protein [Legionella maceachernii]